MQVDEVKIDMQLVDEFVESFANAFEIERPAIFVGGCGSKV